MSRGFFLRFFPEQELTDNSSEIYSKIIPPLISVLIAT